MDFNEVISLVVGHRQRSTVSGSLASNSIQRFETHAANVELGLREGWSGRNTSAGFVTQTAAGDVTWFGLFIGQDDDERSIFGSVAAALACDEIASTVFSCEKNDLRKLVDVANNAITTIQNHRIPTGLDVTSHFGDNANHLRGVAVSGCIGFCTARSIELTRLGACSVLNLTSGQSIVDADLLLEGAPNRYLAPCLSGFGLSDPKYNSRSIHAVTPPASIGVCSLWLHAALSTEAGRAAFARTRSACDWNSLEASLATTSGTSSCAFLSLQSR